MIVLRTTPTVSTIWARKAWWTSEKGRNEASSITASTRSSKSTGRTTTWLGEAEPRAEAIFRYPFGTSDSTMIFFSSAAWPTRTPPRLGGRAPAGLDAVAGQQPVDGVQSVACLGHEEGPELGVDQGGQLGH